jgi:hypothetical protein
MVGKMIAVAVAALLLGHHPALAQAGSRNGVTCTGILINIDINPKAHWPLAVVYDDGGDPLTGSGHTCVVDRGLAGHDPFRGQCNVGGKCRIIGTYLKKIGDTYYMLDWSAGCPVPGGLGVDLDNSPECK